MDGIESPVIHTVQQLGQPSYSTPAESTGYITLHPFLVSALCSPSVPGVLAVEIIPHTNDGREIELLPIRLEEADEE